MNKNRIIWQNGIKELSVSGPVVYWMHRDQRIFDNWALVHAYNLAKKNNKRLEIAVSVRPDLFKHYGTRRLLDFMLTGLRQVERDAHKLNFGFKFLIGDPADTLPKYIKDHQVSHLVSDFSPLRHALKWRNEISEKVIIPFEIIDTHNIIPCHIASPKQEYAARTFRPKVHTKLDEYLDEFPKLKPLNYNFKPQSVDWQNLKKQIKVDESVPAVNLKSGSLEALQVLDDFIQNRLAGYAANRNDPSLDYLSNLSPYLHLGQISAQRIVFELNQINDLNLKNDIDVFKEELIVRKELSDNFCFYNQDYDKIEAAPAWAQETLKNHKYDKREFLYSLEEFKTAQTHDPAWNAAQIQMVKTGKMHGYMRMYWAKKILEWANTPEEALEIAIYLNDRYSIDGRDPNGYVGCLWAIAGLHDRPWFERPVFGKIRYMNFNGLKRKFDIEGYIKKWS